MLCALKNCYYNIDQEKKEENLEKINNIYNISLNLLSISVVFTLFQQFALCTSFHSQPHFAHVHALFMLCIEFVFIAKWENDILLTTKQNYFREIFVIQNTWFVILLDVAVGVDERLHWLVFFFFQYSSSILYHNFRSDIIFKIWL